MRLAATLTGPDLCPDWAVTMAEGRVFEMDIVALRQRWGGEILMF
jgi:hypothetical protein